MDDMKALDILRENYVWDKPKLWIIRPKVKGYKPTELEREAIDELCNEWDFGYEP